MSLGKRGVTFGTFAEGFWDYENGYIARVRIPPLGWS